MVSAFMMLSACATAGRPTSPAVETRFELRLVCPPELALDLPPAPTVPQGAVIRANPPGEAWLDAKDAREQLLAARLTDAAKACPQNHSKDGAK